MRSCRPHRLRTTPVGFASSARDWRSYPNHGHSAHELRGLGCPRRSQASLRYPMYSWQFAYHDSARSWHRVTAPETRDTFSAADIVQSRLQVALEATVEHPLRHKSRDTRDSPISWDVVAQHSPNCSL